MGSFEDEAREYARACQDNEVARLRAQLSLFADRLEEMVDQIREVLDQ